MLKGIDISNWQRTLNLEVIRPQIDFVIMKATEGTGYKDPSLEKFKTQARTLGILRGYYHFARPDLGTLAVKEAEYFCLTLADVQKGELMVLDYEPSWNVSAEQQVNWCLDFLKEVERRLGFKPLIYLNGNQNRTMDWSPVVVNGNGIWLATYPFNTPNFDAPPSTDWPFIAMWQYTSSGRLNGYNGNLDLNVFYGDQAQFQKYGFGSESQPVVPVAPVEPVIPVTPSVPIFSTYTIVKGDSLSSIGARYGIDWKLIYEANKDVIGNNPNFIVPGKILTIPNGSTAPVVQQYTVKPGDSLSKIAGMYGITWQAIYNLNKDIIGSNANFIKSGQVLRIK